MKLLLATKNKGKIAKFGAMLTQLGIDWCSLYDINANNSITVEETGSTVEENSIIKAKAYYEAYSMPVLCDDSGLIIEKFPPEKQPGIYVHRHNGNELTDLEIIDIYSKELELVGGESDGYFIVSLTIIDENGKLHNKTFKSHRYFISKPSDIVVENFPLRSLIYYKDYNKYMSQMRVEEAELAEGQVTIDEKEFIRSILKEDSI